MKQKKYNLAIYSSNAVAPDRLNYGGILIFNKSNKGKIALPIAADKSVVAPLPAIA